MNEKNTGMVLSQVVVIVLASVAAVYTFQHIQTPIKISGVPAYYYISYLLAFFLCYFSVRKHDQYLALVLSLLVLITFFSILLHVRHVVEFLPIITFSLAVLIGVFSVFLVPSERGRYFVTFLFVLIFPAILSESQVNWNRFFQDMVTLGETYSFLSPLALLFEIFREGFLLLTNDVRVNPYELYTVCLVVVAGYMYLRYLTQITLTQQEFGKRGASAKDIANISNGSLLIAGIAASAIAVTAFVIAIMPLIVNVMQPLFIRIPLPIFLFAIGTGTAIVATVYMFAKRIVGVLPGKMRSKITPGTLKGEISIRSGVRRSRERGGIRYLQTPWGVVDLEHWRRDKHEEK